MVDLLGKPLGRIESPVEGIVLFVVTSPAIKKDDFFWESASR